MNCIIPGQNVKVFAKVLQAMAKIGDELYIEANKEQVSLITLNLRKTVCVRQNLLDVFFSNYDVDVTQITDKVSCKIHMKTLLPLFKGTHLDKKVDYVKLEYDNSSDFIVIKIKYKLNIILTHHLRLMDPETITMDVSLDSGCNNIVTTSTFYNRLLNMLSTSDDEILFEIAKDKAIIRNYDVDAPVKSKSVRSQISPNGSEFSIYKINLETTVNFTLKPFRTAVQFAEIFNLKISLYFDQGGKPLNIVMKNPTFAMHFIIATINPYDSQTVTSTIPAKISEKNKEVGEDGGNKKAHLSGSWNEVSLERVDNKNIVTKNSSKTSRSQQISDSLNVTKSNSNDDNTSISRKKKLNENIYPQELCESPSRKKIKLVFGSCFEPPFSIAQLGDILVPNSDSE